MGRRVPVIGQLAHPRGVLAPATGFVLNIVNRPINRWTIRALELGGTEQVLDVGFGGGVGLEMVAKRLTSGRVVGIDISEEMAQRAVALAPVIRADVAALPLADDSFDRAYSVNGIFFWPDPEAALAEIHRVLRSGSLAIIAGPTSAFVLARLSGVGPRTAPFGPMQVATLAERAGFESVRIGRTIGAAQILGRKG